MRKIQLTIIQIDNYGPWTVMPEPRREFELQVLQAELFAELERQFGTRGGLVFPTRFDNLIAVTNGISMEEHREIQKVVNEKFPVTVSMSIGAAATPYQAQVLATLCLQRVGSSQSAERKSALVGSCVSYPDQDWVQIAHMDINHSTLITDSEPIYDTHVLLQRAHLVLVQKFLRCNALVFYMGGDNIMALSNGLEVSEISDVLAEVKAEMGLELKAGVGAAPTAERAAQLASEGLHEIRKNRHKSTIILKRA
ncbi:MAG: GTP cyclohydrolase IIa [Candidatus Hadarchaeum sp.]|uniref:GTP cyclohydrolase IIa n=1 Tax=Candidatus Hadarchaeum sp. TaxID=2883567 RepID=UPI003D0BE817